MRVVIKMSVNHGSRNYGDWGLVRKIGPWKPTARDRVGAGYKNDNDMIRPAKIVGNKPHPTLSKWAQRSVVSKQVYDVGLRKPRPGMRYDSTPAILKGINQTLIGLGSRIGGVNQGEQNGGGGNGPGNGGGAPRGPGFQNPGTGPQDPGLLSATTNSSDYFSVSTGSSDSGRVYSPVVSLNEDTDMKKLLEVTGMAEEEINRHLRELEAYVSSAPTQTAGSSFVQSPSLNPAPGLSQVRYPAIPSSVSDFKPDVGVQTSPTEKGQEELLQQFMKEMKDLVETRESAKEKEFNEKLKAMKNRADQPRLAALVDVLNILGLDYNEILNALNRGELDHVQDMLGEIRNHFTQRPSMVVSEIVEVRDGPRNRSRDRLREGYGGRGRYGLRINTDRDYKEESSPDDDKPGQTYGTSTKKPQKK